ncbi:Growth factor receptor-bound protein 10 [Merluccius polli]|uniref:Growth factor receptor-bound protein 10 n=1 Tax=Merluccius polli TaxID=89951 RepID=A0AA47MYG0_MERPO|nr:Growth factor receptor-bound protein 10 [Merluccius polli]
MTELARPRAEAEETEEEYDSFMTSSTLTLDLLADMTPAAQRAEPRPPPHSQPITIPPVRVQSDEGRSSSLSTIPNPFPELCIPAQPPVLIGSGPPLASDKHMIKVFGEDSFNCLWVSRVATAKEVSHLLMNTADCSEQENWALFEFHSTHGLERCLEDHEVILQVQNSWSIKQTNAKLLFRKNYAKYAFFRTPALFFPEAMIAVDSVDASHGMKSSELIQILLESGSCPEIQGFLQVKDPTRWAWKRVYFVLRRSGFYSSTEPHHLQCIADLAELGVFQVVNGRMLYGSPSDYTFCIKHDRDPVDTRNLKVLCAETEEARTCWTSAFRLFKYGKQLHSNFQFSKSAAQWSKDRAESRLNGQTLSSSFFPLGNTKPVCLMCSETVALIKSANVKRHYETKHKVFHQTYPLMSELRSQKISSLRAQYEQSTRILTHSLTAQQRANERSLRVTWILGQHKKPFTDGGVAKECMSAAAETLLEGKQKEELCDKIKQTPMSASSATKKSEMLTQDVLAQLDEAIHKHVLAVDESTDVSDNAQLLVYVRFFNQEKKEFCEDVLGVTPLETSTRGEDIYLAIREMLTKRGIEP